MIVNPASQRLQSGQNNGLLTVVVTMMATWMLAGCQASSRPTPPKGATTTATTAAVPSKGKIGISVLTMTNPFFKEIADTLTAEAAKHGYETIITSGEFDVAKQQNQVKDFLVAHCAAIVLCPCDSRAIGPVIQEANAAGVPVFTADIACKAPDAKVVCHIATDNLEGGRQAGHAMIEALGEAGGKVVVLDARQIESAQSRVQGFKEVLAQHNKGRTQGKIAIVAELPGDGQKDKGYKAAEDALQSHPDMVGLFAVNDPSALGARAAIEKAGKAEQIKIVGFDGQPDGRQAIAEGKIFADPVQFPDRIGKYTFEMIQRHFDGEAVAAEYLIPTGLLTKEGMREPPAPTTK